MTKYWPGMKMEFPDWLQEELNKRHWSQSDLARAADLNRAVINKLLNQRSQPHVTTLGAIARALKIPTESVYRAAGLLPELTDGDAFLEEAYHKLSLIQNPQHRSTAILLLDALIAEEEKEKTKR